MHCVKPTNSSFVFVDAKTGEILGRDEFHDPGFIATQDGRFCWPMYGGTPLGPIPDPPKKGH